LETREFTSDGRPWTVRAIAPGELSYGSSPVDAATVEFYDKRQAGEHFGPLGQFVSSYYIETLLDGDDGDLDLVSDIPEWSIDVATMVEIRAWLASIAR